MALSTPSSRALRNAVDVLIVGGGPAGLSAALALGRVNRSVFIFDSGQYRNQASKHAHTVPMHDHEDPAEIRRKMKKELQAKYKTVTFVNKSVTSVQESDGIFKLLDTDGGCWNGRKLILATGCFDILPNIVGYKESWGKGIFHCPFCHGFEQARNGSVSMAVLLSQQACPRELEEFWFLHTTLRQFSQKMTVLANGNTIQNLARPGIWAGETSVQPQVVARIEYVESDNHVAVEYCDGALDTFDMVYHSPATQLSGKLHADVGLDMHPAGAIQTVSPMQETSVRGVFAAGDCAGLLKKMAVAMGSGVSVGIGAHYQILCDDY